MKQIYINTHLGTIRINWDETLPGDVIITATQIGSILGVVQDDIEATGIDPLDMETHDAEQQYCIVNKANLFFDQDIKQLADAFKDVDDSVTSYGHQHDTEYVND
jgi:hypothetical protein